MRAMVSNFLYFQLGKITRTAGHVFIAELLCGRRPQKWSPIPILRGMLVIFYGHGKRNGSRARAPYIRTSHFMTFLHEAIFPGRAETKEKRRR